MVMPRASLVQQLNRLASDRWSRRGLRIILRSAIIALALWCIGLALNIWLGWPLPTMWLRILSLLVVGVGMFAAPAFNRLAGCAPLGSAFSS
jgi:small-conductance mechanosensitive channel